MKKSKIVGLLIFSFLLLYVAASDYSSRPAYADELKSVQQVGKTIAIGQKISASVNDYITAKKHAFNERKGTDGNKEVIATISFKNWASIGEIIDIANHEGIDVQSVNFMHRGKDLGHGELFIRQNQEIQSVWDSMTSVQINDLKKKLNETNSDFPRQSVDKMSKKIANLEKEIPMIHSIRVQATLNNLDKLYQINNIRLIDIPDKSDVERAIFNNLSELDIRILGIIPDDVLVFKGVPQEI